MSHTARPLTAAMVAQFPVGSYVRYRPGVRTYGYEDALEADGRVPAEVVGHAKTRIRIVITLRKRGGQRVARGVDAGSLILAGRDGSL